MAGRLGSAMASGPAVACTKTLLTVFNFIFWISGIAVLALGIWTKVELHVYMELSTVYFRDAPYILIGVGAVIVLVGSFGCCCTFKGHSILLYMYGVFLVIVFAVELACGAAGFIYKAKLEKGFSDGLKDGLNTYGTDNDITKAFDGLQENLHCCGKDGYTDWFTSKWEETVKTANKTHLVPTSCCHGDKTKCVNYNLPEVITANTTLDINTQGCYHTVTEFMQKNMAMIGGVALGISFFQLIGALLSCCLARNLNKSKYEQVQ